MPIKTEGLLLAGLLLALIALPARADPVADFYKGRTINVVIGTSARRRLRPVCPRAGQAHGAAYPRRAHHGAAEHARRRHAARHALLNGVAPKDGTVIATFSRSMPLAPVLGLPGASFDATSSPGSEASPRTR